MSESQRVKLAELVKSNTEAGQQFDKLKREADAALTSKPNPIRKIQSEGKLKTDPVKIKTAESLRDMEKLHALGWVFAVTGDVRYAAQARAFLLAWAKENVPTGDPIDETRLSLAFVAFDLTRRSFSAEEHAAVSRWLRQIAVAELKHEKVGAATSFNNWHSHRLKIIGLIGYALEDKGLIERAVAGYRKQIETNLHADGSSYDFHERDALHYHCYDLEPLLVLALAARENGTDLYSFHAKYGASLGKSVQFLTPYCTGAKTHAEFLHSKVAFDAKRAASGDKHYEAGRPFEPKSGATVLELAAAFDESVTSVYFKATGATPSKFSSWQFVLNSARTGGEGGRQPK